jgi:peroxiredoxin Q/BCP
MKAIQTGQSAPDFNALDQNRERFFLSKAVQKGKVLLAFYPGDDTPVCTTQLSDYSKNIEEFKKRGVQVYGISISTNESQKKFADQLELKFPLLADYDTRVTTKYGVMSFRGHPKRALFLIDGDRKVVYRQVECMALSYRSSEEVLGSIDELYPPAPPTPKTEAPQPAAEESH